MEMCENLRFLTKDRWRGEHLLEVFGEVCNWEPCGCGIGGFPLVSVSVAATVD